MTLKDKTAIVGIGATPYYKRGRSLPQTPLELAGKATLAALDDAGLTIADVDGLALYSMGLGGDTSLFAQTLGIPEVRFTAMLTGGGGGAAGSDELRRRRARPRAAPHPGDPHRQPGRGLLGVNLRPHRRGAGRHRARASRAGRPVPAHIPGTDTSVDQLR